MIKVEVKGNPAPQGSKRPYSTPGGKTVMVESSKAVKPWREAVKWACIEQARDIQIAGAVVVQIIFTMPKPKSAPKSRVTFPDRKPDIDKLVRSTLDAITQVGLIEDDARIVQLWTAKVFPGEHKLSLPVPGAVIMIGQQSEVA